MSALARTSDPETSRIAAASVSATQLEDHVATVVRAAGAWGLTSIETAVRLQMDLVTVSPRFRPLVRKGVLCESGFVRVGCSGRPATVWVHSDFAADSEATLAATHRRSGSHRARRSPRQALVILIAAARRHSISDSILRRALGIAELALGESAQSESHLGAIGSRDDDNQREDALDAAAIVGAYKPRY